MDNTQPSPAGDTEITPFTLTATEALRMDVIGATAAHMILTTSPYRSSRGSTLAAGLILPSTLDTLPRTKSGIILGKRTPLSPTPADRRDIGAGLPELTDEHGEIEAYAPLDAATAQNPAEELDVKVEAATLPAEPIVTADEVRHASLTTPPPGSLLERIANETPPTLTWFPRETQTALWQEMEAEMQAAEASAPKTDKTKMALEYFNEEVSPKALKEFIKAEEIIGLCIKNNGDSEQAMQAAKTHFVNAKNILSLGLGTMIDEYGVTQQTASALVKGMIKISHDNIFKSPRADLEDDTSRQKHHALMNELFTTTFIAEPMTQEQPEMQKKMKLAIETFITDLLPTATTELCKAAQQVEVSLLLESPDKIRQRRSVMGKATKACVGSSAYFKQGLQVLQDSYDLSPEQLHIVATEGLRHMFDVAKRDVFAKMADTSRMEKAVTLLTSIFEMQISTQQQQGAGRA